VNERVLSLGDRAKRARRISFTFGKIYLGIKGLQLLQLRLGRRAMRGRWSRFHRASAVSIHRAAVDLHGLILKGCQYLGSRADVLPPEYAEVLSELQDQVPPKPFAVVLGIVEKELGRSLGEVFREFDETPVAAASLAQVHRATLHTGERVAVKVQYPEIPILVRSDLGNLRALFRAVGLIEREFDLMPLIDELAREMPRELDFENEAANLLRIGATFEHRDDISTPRVYPHLSTSRVLVMEFIEGIKISDRDAMRRRGIDSTEVMRSLIEAYCEQIFIHGDFHADPHPGNLLVQPGKAATDRPRIVFLDFGLTKTLPASFRTGIVQFAAGLLQGKTDVMANALSISASRRATAGRNRSFQSRKSCWNSEPAYAASRSSKPSSRAARAKSFSG
jgi:predicted unusual protein kinase regulating ubiquinone biosynthesis (AarF/ABC1/UbiB family)